MFDFNICLCGAEAGYPHASDCPWPLYRCSPTKELQWTKDRDELRRRIAEGYLAEITQSSLANKPRKDESCI